MELIRGRVNLHGRQRGCVVTIGTYDGIHLGHQALLQRLIEHAMRLSAPTVVLTFEPMPREYLHPDAPPARLTSLRERWRVLEAVKLDYLLLLRFGESLRNLSGEAFASPSRAAVHAMQTAGYDRPTENGWQRWKTAAGVTLAELREQFLNGTH